MPFDQIYLVYCALFLGVLFLIEGLFYLVVDLRGGHRDPNRRVRMLSAGQSREAVLVQLRRERRLGAPEGKGNPLAKFETLIIQAGVTASLYRVAFVMFALGAGSFLATYVVKENPLISGLVALSAGMILPILYLMLRRRRRLNRFALQLPDAVDVIVRSLKAGHPVPTAIAMVAKEMADPIGSEFGIVADEMTYGLDLDVALRNMTDRVGLADLNFLVVAVAIQSRVGGNLAEILAALSRVIRERFRMRGKIKALSAEGRFSAVVLSILPFIMIAAISVLNPTYYSEVTDDSLFTPVMTVGFSLMAIGIFVMYRMVNFRI